MDDEKLIETVRNCPCLYDKSHKDFKSYTQKKIAWKRVGKIMGVNDSLVMARWKNLRERFTKEIRAPKNVERPWLLLESLQFLKAHIIPRPMRQNIRKVESSDEDDNPSSSAQSTSKPDQIDGMTLIQLVKEHEYIYNRRNKYYTSVDKRRNAWREIARKMGVNRKHCMRYWTNLRERYTKENRRMTALSNNGLTTDHLWHMYNEMEFLKPHIIPKHTYQEDKSFSLKGEEHKTDEDEKFIVEHEDTNDDYECITHPFQFKDSTSVLSEQEMEHEEVDIFYESDQKNRPTSSKSQNIKKLNESIETFACEQQVRCTKRHYESDVEEEETLPLCKQGCGGMKLRRHNPIVEAFGKMIVETISSMGNQEQAIAMQKVTELVMNLKVQAVQGTLFVPRTEN
ncbi:uncharacterized protein LOC101459444 [Ceratitis capitata]|uniref:Transcription factor Adf-1 n=1 Tax=Ceratitis capitata TaxID=7213 RepID=W8B9D4_CERCA|nr:uncharacterized protein LOC101459444 [Ceratitis capitata]